MIPGFDDEYIVNSIAHSSKLRAIVLELYGTGNVSSRKASLIDALSLAIKKGIVIVATSQCLRGTVDLQAYALGAKLATIGVIVREGSTGVGIVAYREFPYYSFNILPFLLACVRCLQSGQDMTVEAVTCKLAYLLTWPRMNAAELRTLMGKR